MNHGGQMLLDAMRRKLDARNHHEPQSCNQQRQTRRHPSAEGITADAIPRSVASSEAGISPGAIQRVASGKSTALEALMYCTDDDMKITKTGRVTITKDGISVEGFNVKGAMCRDAAVMAAAWAIGELQREMLRTIQKPGGGNISVD